jgi:hypothetical protein
MRLIWATLLTSGLLLVALNVFEQRATGPTGPGMSQCSREDGTGFPPPDPTPRPK